MDSREFSNGFSRVRAWIPTWILTWIFADSPDILEDSIYNCNGLSLDFRGFSLGFSRMPTWISTWILTESRGSSVGIFVILPELPGIIAGSRLGAHLASDGFACDSRGLSLGISRILAGSSLILTRISTWILTWIRTWIMEGTRLEYN